MTLLEKAKLIKKEIDHVIRKNLITDTLYQYESIEMKNKRWDKTRNFCSDIVDKYLLNGGSNEEN